VATYTKFRKTGEWAIKAERHNQPGDWVTVERRDGQARRAQLGDLLWAGDAVAIYRIAGRDRTLTPEPRRADDHRDVARPAVEELPAPPEDAGEVAPLAPLLARPARIDPPDYVAAHLAHEASDGQGTSSPAQDLRRTADDIPIF